MNQPPKEIRALFEACAHVGARYFSLPIATASGSIPKSESIYRERVYCYELYHQWRMRWPVDSRYDLSGELDKSGHPLVRRPKKPDFLVHVPGRMDNLAVIEVKAANTDMAALLKDVKTLTFFRKSLGLENNYAHAYLLIYGMTEARWRATSSTLAQRARKDAVDLAAIDPVIHPDPGERAEVMGWE